MSVTRRDERDATVTGLILRTPAGHARRSVASFVHVALPGRVLFGSGASRRHLAEEVDGIGASRVLVIATERGRALVEELARPFADRVVGVFTGVQRHVPVDVAVRARQAASDGAPDCLLAVGGGSTLGTAKAIVLEAPMPIVAVPTTYAGSEMTPIWGLTDEARKATGRSFDVLPRTVVYDPELTLSLPPSLAGTSAMNAMAHCVGALYAPGPIRSPRWSPRRPSVSSYAGSRRWSSDSTTSTRAETLYGSYLAGASLAAAGTSLHHKLCHILGGAYDLPHAEVHAVVLPHTVAFVQDAVPALGDGVADVLGTGDAATGLFSLLERIGGPTSLREVGMREADLEEAVALVSAAAPAALPSMDEQDVRTILHSAYAGRPPARRPATGDRERAQR